jgi:pimeloyl-ACP methyl ester carboxylesterase
MNVVVPDYEIVTPTNSPQAPWLTLVHAAAQDRRVWAPQVEAFRNNFRLLLLDLPGHGRSADRVGPYGFAEYADSVLAALDELGVATTHFMGTHTGSAVGLILAAHVPERFITLVLEGPPIPGVDMPAISEGLARARATARDHGIEAARRSWFEHGDWYRVMRAHPERCRADAHWRIVAEFPGAPWLDMKAPRAIESHLDHLEAIHIPTLVFNGEGDVADFVAAADELERRLPDVRRERISGAGGFPSWEAPETVNAIVSEFLAAHA